MLIHWNWIYLGNAMALAMESVKGNSGSMTSFIGGTEMLLGGISVMIVGIFYDGTMMPIGVIVTLFMLFNLALLFQSRRRPVVLKVEDPAASA